ncbi:arginine-tRNA-protein transferas-like protein 1 [Amylocarpus encephaloides]|uniref:arginyltransferase n=1 Tax=Amylocarpus encephaloides TaxID=45428 RepID=A0A9P7YKQ5_9HELO|nr:arginine-tRNA-protein transferas-like protein 1 [Amylocarpus encephaloides]
MSTPDRVRSLLTPIGYRNSGCGYCHNESGSFSYYVSTSELSCALYQSLLDRGWRRSGRLLYKPDQYNSCCPQYTIRLDSESFHPTKDQRQTLNRFNKHILGDSYIKEAARLHPLSREQAKKRNIDFDVVERVHESEKYALKTPPEPAHDLVVTLESNTFTVEKYQVFENYQRIVHQEPPNKISKYGFEKFLCDSPLPASTLTSDGQDRKLGSYHQCYRIDGKLIAIGVLDLLPQCVSAVYFMYHESVHKHGLGKLGALREIALAREYGYKWWYAGFYIHSCIKMRYKGDYSPQYLLDPASYDWNLLDDKLKKQLDGTKYFSATRQNSSAISAPSTDTAIDTSTDTANGVNSDSESTYSEDAEDPPIPNPELPLFSRSIPGILTKEELNAMDLDHIRIKIGEQEAVTSDLVGWGPGSVDEGVPIKKDIAEMVASVGKEVAAEMVVSFN